MPAYLKINDDIHWMRNNLITFNVPDHILGFSLDVFRYTSYTSCVNNCNALRKQIESDPVLVGTELSVTSYDCYYPKYANPSTVWAEDDLVSLLAYEAGRNMMQLRNSRVRACLTRT